MSFVSQIDFSIFVGDTKSYGRVHGTLELPVAPSMSSAISLTFPIKPGIIYRPIADFSGELQVERLMPVPGSDRQPMLEIPDVCLGKMRVSLLTT